MTAPITPDERAVLRALADAATEGPWEADGPEVSQHWSRPEPWLTVASSEVACMSYCYGGSARGIERDEDARFIAAARTAVPRLLDALDTAEKRAEHYRVQRDWGFEEELKAREAAETEVVFLRTRIRKARNQRDQARAKVDRQSDRLRSREEQVRRLRAEVTRLHALVATERAELRRFQTALEGSLRASNIPGTNVSWWSIIDDSAPPVPERAVARGHGLVKPDRESVIERLAARWWDLNMGDSDTWVLLTPDEREDVVDKENLALLADAVLAEWPGQSRAEVQAEALREFARSINLEELGNEWEGDDPDLANDLHWAASNAASTVQMGLYARADRLEKGADRG